MGATYFGRAGHQRGVREPPIHGAAARAAPANGPDPTNDHNGAPRCLPAGGTHIRIRCHPPLPHNPRLAEDELGDRRPALVVQADYYDRSPVLTRVALC
ncbi:hypothetical protein MTO96_013319 [Rhipicephalus appendiculatus]